MCINMFDSLQEIRLETGSNADMLRVEKDWDSPLLSSNNVQNGF